MDTIRKLLNDGLTPETLVKRGATPKYVTAVCEEIVEGTRRRKALWLGSTPQSHPSGSSTHMESVNMSSQRSGGSGESEVEVLVSTDRRMSLSSEGSAEYELIENPSPPLPRPPRLIPSSHWAPSPPRQIASLSSKPAQQQAIPAKPVKIESYKPAPTITPTQALADSRPTPVPLIRPVSSFVPSPPKPNSAGLPNKPIPTGPKLGTKRSKQQHRQQHRSKDAHLPEGPSTLNYGDDEVADTKPTPSLPTVSKADLPARPIVSYDAQLPIQDSLLLSSASNQRPPKAPVISIPPVAASARPSASEAQAEIDAKNAIIEIRRKALASMRLRRQHKAEPVEQSSTNKVNTAPESISGHSTPIPTSAMERTIEQEVLDLEQEVLGLQQAAEQSPRESEPMDLDSPEEGEITPSSLPVPLPIIPQVLPISSASLPTWNRGVKRPNAEELDARPLSAPNTWIKRKPFGGGPQRPGRLLVNLDEGSDDDSDEDTAKIDPTPFIVGLGLVQEKDEQIRLLKEKIAAKLREREAKKLRGEGVSPTLEAAVTVVRSIADSTSAEGETINRSREVMLILRCCDSPCREDFAPHDDRYSSSIR